MILSCYVVRFLQHYVMRFLQHSLPHSIIEAGIGQYKLIQLRSYSVNVYFRLPAAAAKNAIKKGPGKRPF
jgi:hypothetical protein